MAARDWVYPVKVFVAVAQKGHPGANEGIDEFMPTAHPNAVAVQLRATAAGGNKFLPSHRVIDHSMLDLAAM